MGKAWIKPAASLPDRGFIYAYTLSHLLDKSPKKKEWLQIQHLKSEKLTTFNPKKHILIKVGMTRGDVAKRLRQWQAQCSHKLVLVDPHLKHNRSLASLFQCLSMQNEYQSYITEQNGFQCPHKLFEVEQSIHRALRNKYGRGDVLCQGCKDQGRGLHVEWFKLPRDDLMSLFSLIDNTINAFNAI